MGMQWAGGARRRGALLLSLATVTLAAVPMPVRANPPATVAVLARLSNLRTVSRWAYPSSEALVHADPSGESRVIGHLRFLTDDDQAELYLALDSARMSSGQTWIKIELPARPNGQTGWVASSALESLHTVTGYLLVDRARLRATLFRDGRSIFSAPIGVGRASTITPPGNFYVMEKLVTLNDPAYGPLALGTSAYAPTLSEWPGGGIVGIHGTDEPQLIPGRPSHGCIRMRNADIKRLWSLISVGTPIEIT
ncbi:MAG TPA: L,D-transpeptidase [Solirubrobacteraceae bacterium]